MPSSAPSSPGAPTPAPASTRWRSAPRAGRGGPLSPRGSVSPRRTSRGPSRSSCRRRLRVGSSSASSRPSWAVRLSLGHATLPLPALAAFRDLAVLSLASVALAPGQGGHLGALLSSPCCLRLRRLSLEFLTGMPELRLEAAALEVLELAFLLDLRWFHVDAGALRVLRIKGCFAWTEEVARAGTVATVKAPALVELACPHTRGTELLELDGCSRVRRLDEICIRSNLRPWCDAGENDFAVELLRSCNAAHRFHLCLEVPPSSLVRRDYARAAPAIRGGGAELHPVLGVLQHPLAQKY
ncbi:hypothetical protein SEVIR_9G380600v4 [Setaria viridis]|uniref:FBD domain-containing protein n=1 Tax=Setaria viridis TaxID=4556 RepID=A0A4U6T3S4_SETVI|nr:uncharacterized protein LOC117839219 [Setaria viridis]TKV95721.1 hypothetical protein SEVIR_9G380600v2 [Setaria viridis]